MFIYNFTVSSILIVYLQYQPQQTKQPQQQQYGGQHHSGQHHVAQQQHGGQHAAAAQVIVSSLNHLLSIIVWLYNYKDMHFKEIYSSRSV